MAQHEGEPSCPYGDKECPKNRRIEQMLVVIIGIMITEGIGGMIF